jgi:hypothetical protein
VIISGSVDLHSGELAQTTVILKFANGENGANEAQVAQIKRKWRTCYKSAKSFGENEAWV